MRSILRHPNTPGTGQNVRFFSRDAYRTISPESSQEPDYQSLSPVFPESHDIRSVATLDHDESDALASFLFGGPNASGPASSSTPAGAVLSRSASSPGPQKSRPSLSEVFSHMDDERQEAHDPDMSLDRIGNRPIPAPDFNSILDTSGQMDDPPVPPGLGYDGDESAGNAPQGNDDRDSSAVPTASVPMTSSPLSTQMKDKGKERASSNSKDQHSLLPSAFQEKVFHHRENPPRPNPVHDRSHSFSFGQTVFFSAGANSNNSNNNSNSSKSPTSATSISPLTSIRPPFSESNSSESAASSTRLSNGRSRALSDTIFHSRAMSPTGGSPETDINDESSPELFSTQAEPDPFSAHAKTYYTPQTMIPTTPPQRQHVRRSSKEENIIYSLQTQLTLQTELCGQYEADLRTRDEMVEMLNNKIADMDKEENRKKAVLRTWRKKVQELEKAVRHLEEELDDSRQESMERSVMDEASGEALRTLHRQIASLEREKAEWSKVERSFREEMEKLEHLVTEKDDAVEHLSGLLQKKDESEREWQENLGEAKARDFADEEESQRPAAEGGQQKATELELDTLRDQMKARDEEYSILRAELEAQWQHTEDASEKLHSLEKERAQLETEKKTLQHERTTLEEKVASLEVEWQESEGRRNELESELQEVWNEKEALEKERDQVSQAKNLRLSSIRLRAL